MDARGPAFLCLHLAVLRQSPPRADELLPEPLSPTNSAADAARTCLRPPASPYALYEPSSAIPSRSNTSCPRHWPEPQVVASLHLRCVAVDACNPGINPKPQVPRHYEDRTDKYHDVRRSSSTLGYVKLSTVARIKTGKFEDPKYLFEMTEYHYRRTLERLQAETSSSSMNCYHEMDDPTSSTTIAVYDYRRLGDVGLIKFLFEKVPLLPRRYENNYPR
ncbi:hypothetical protein TRIUR3_28213 [Triticum urartu]|uniref:Uncharacterized protein n=1 Tax=Triticum urartu TaxID=4572 RepID=M7ZQP3_TRIUA|nr:hypothetical protein TRIUR3_28213 [Triticum urartu]